VRAALVLLLVAACHEPKPAPSASATIEISRDRGALTAWDARAAELRGTMIGATATASVSTLIPKDRPTLLTFWATYCPPCIEEMRHLQLIHSQGRAIIGISLDTSDPAAAARVMSQMKVNYPNVVLDSASTRTAGAALERGLPFSIALDAKGRAFELLSGGLEGAEIEAIFARGSRLPRP
jgi:thiol-disulfide isomerase/thioredoxin